MRLMLMAAAREELGKLPGEVVGVGPVAAAAGAARLLHIHRPEAVVMLGSAGAYPRGPAVGTAIASARLGLSSGIATLGLGYVPRAPAPLAGAPHLLASLKVDHRPVLTVSAITTDSGLAARLSDGWDVEHLEAYGVAWACQQAGVPFVAVLGVSNEVGPGAHAQWLTHRDAAHAAAQAAVAPLLR